MGFLIELLVLLASGAAIVRLIGIERHHWAHDLPLSWFLGSGWFALASWIWTLALSGSVHLGASLAILALPIAAWVALRGRSLVSEPSPPSGGDPPGTWYPAGDRALWALVTAYVAIVWAAIVVHGVSSPPSGVDAMLVRALAPFHYVASARTEGALDVIAQAGSLPSVLPSVAWQISGGTDPFTLKYLALVHLSALLLLLYSRSSLAGEAERGLLGPFLILSIPLFLYHAAGDYGEVFYIAPAAAGLVFFGHHLHGRSHRDLAAALALVACAGLAKDRGEVNAFALVGMMGAWVLFAHPRTRITWLVRGAVLSLPLCIHTVMRAMWSTREVALESIPDRVEKLLATPPPAPPPTLDPVAPAAPLPTNELAAFVEPLEIFLRGLFSSPNTGLFYFVLVGGLLIGFVRPRATRTVPLFSCLVVLFALLALDATVLRRDFTLDGTAVHRSIMGFTVCCAAALPLCCTLPRRRGSAKDSGESR